VVDRLAGSWEVRRRCGLSLRYSSIGPLIQVGKQQQPEIP
jgi:hypothetical protein